jgi:putative transposase
MSTIVTARGKTLLGSLKMERLRGQRFKTKRPAMDEVVAWMFWYQRTRLHSTLTYVSPMRFEEHWHANHPRQVSA